MSCAEGSCIQDRFNSLVNAAASFLSCRPRLKSQESFVRTARGDALKALAAERHGSGLLFFSACWRTAGQRDSSI
jgi:hypothetical protein